MWVINEAKNAGVNFTVPSSYKKVTNPIVHDSVAALKVLGIEANISQFDPSREFLWAEQSVKGPSQFITQSHLKLNWVNTVQFQGRNQNKFEKIKEISEAMATAKSCSSVQLVCLGKSKEQYRKEYKVLKAKVNDTILYNTSEEEKIKINSYVQWLKDKGYAIGTSNNLSIN